MSALSELLTNANTNGWSYEVIAEKAQERGHRLSRDTAWRYMTGRQREVAEQYLRALADVLGLPWEAARQAAQLPADLGEYRPPAEANALSQPEREAVDLLIKAIARGRGAAGASQSAAGTVRELHQAASQPAVSDAEDDQELLAARRGQIQRSPAEIAQDHAGEETQDVGDYEA